MTDLFEHKAQGQNERTDPPGKSDPEASPGPSRRTFARGLVATGLAALPVIGAPRIARADVLKVAAILPLSGALGAYGEQARLGLELAKAEIASAGGIDGRPISLDYRDEAADPRRAEEAAQAAVVDDNVIAVVGPITSASRNAMSATLSRAGMPLLYATDYEGGDCGDTLFYFNSVPNQSAAPLMRHLLDSVEGSVFMLGADYVWPREMFNACADVIRSRGRRLVGRRFIPLAGLADYAPVIDEIGYSGATILMLALPGTPHNAFIAEAAQADWFTYLTVGVLGGLAMFFEPGDKAPDTSAYGCMPFVETDPAASVQDFVSRVRRLAGEDVVVSSYAATHYNALMALSAGLDRSGEITRAGAIAGMAGLTYQTPTGPSVIGAGDRHSTLNMYIVEVADGRLEVVKPLGTIKPDADCAQG
jgi:urea transport system substrate-binding protein